jgi:hypothetical protein
MNFFITLVLKYFKERRVMGEGNDLGMFGENFQNSSFSQTIANNNGSDASYEQIMNILSSKKNYKQ